MNFDDKIKLAEELVVNLTPVMPKIAGANEKELIIDMGPNYDYYCWEKDRWVCVDTCLSEEEAFGNFESLL